MSSVDSRVVEMKFNNSAFAKGIADTLTGLQKLQDSLRLPGATKGLQDVTKAAGEFNSQPMEQGASRIAGGFTALQAVALGALASIGNKAVATGQQLLASFSGFDSIKQGFQEYETNMNSIQTILANTKQAGTGLTEVNAALDEMNLYSDKTIYNFAEMAKNVGTFTAAGVDLDTATGSIKGIANLAALSGSNSQQAAGAMYQLSQEIAAGKVTLMGWNSVVNAGMGGSVFQRALAETAVAMGKIDQSSLKLEGDMKNVVINGKAFRDSISAEGGQESWLTSDVLTNTLQQFTGDLSDAELAAQGFSAAQIQSIKDTATMAVGAATEVKTFTGLVDTLKEGMASGWSQTFRIIVGDFEEAKTLFTGISNAVGGFLGDMADSRNALLTVWKDMGGRDKLIQGLTDAFWLLGAPLAQVGEAFRQIFPAMRPAELLRMTDAFAAFMAEIQPTPETLDRIQRTFAGLFAILGIGWEIIKGVANFLGDMLLGLTEGDNGILKITASIGDWLVALHEAVVAGNGITKFFDGLVVALFKVLNPIRDFGSYIGDLFEAAGPGSDRINQLTDSLNPLAAAGDAVGSVWSKLGSIFTAIKSIISNFMSDAAEFFSQFGGNFTNAFGEIDYASIMDALQLGLGAGFLVVLKQLANSIGNFSIFGDSGGGMLDSIKDALDGVSETMQAMQANLKANALIKIAGAIAIMAAAVWVLAGIDAAGLTRATAALTVMFIQLGAAMKVFATVATPVQTAKLLVMGAALILLSIAVTILASAVKKLSEINLGDLARGLLGLQVMLRQLATAVEKMSTNNGKMISTAAGLVILGLAIKILVSAVEDLSELGWEELAKGLIGVGVLLRSLALFTKMAEADKMSLSQGLGILLLAAALKVLASAVKDFAEMSWGEMVKGLTGVSVGLIAISGALKRIPKGAIFSAAAVAIVAFSLQMISDAMKDMGDMDWGTIAKGLTTMAFSLNIIAGALNRLPPQAILSAAAIFVAAAALGMIADALAVMGGMSMGDTVQSLILLAGALTIISIGLKAMQNSLPGALALFVVAGALTVLNGVLQQFADMSVGEIVKSLLMLAGVFLVIGVAGLVLGPITPILLLLGAAVFVLGAGMALAGAGVMLFALGLTALAAAGAAGTAAIIAIVSGLIGLIPLVMEQIGLGIIAFATVIATAGPAILAAITTVLTAFLQAIIDTAPKAGEAFMVLLRTVLGVLVGAIPLLVEAGFRILIGFLDGIGRNIGRVVDKATDIVVNFLNGLSRNLPRIIQAGIDLIISFVNGLADGIRNNKEKMTEAGVNLAKAIVEGMVSGIKGGVKMVTDAAKGLAKDALNAAKEFLGINSPSRVFREVVGMAIPEGIAVGIDKYGYMAENSTEDMGKSLLTTMGKTISGLGSMVSDMDEFNPVITPVLDLSALQAGSSKIGDILGAAPIDLREARANAGDASAGYYANREALSELAEANGGTTVNMTQINNSPKALSQADIYRNTNNQISKVKGALTNAN